MSRTLLTLLGTGKYVPVRYELDGGLAAPTPYVQAAIAERLAESDARADRVVVLLTQKAREMHWAPLRDALGAHGYAEGDGSLLALDIPDGKNEDELWQVFEVIGRASEGAGELVFDATHAFRSLQLVTLLALTFYRNAGGAKLDRVLYGAFDAGAEGAAPIFDLTEMLLLPAWAEAAAEWARTGTARGLLELSEAPASDLRRRLRGPSPLATLVERVRDVSHVLSLVRHADIGERALAAREAAGGHRDEAGGARLAPMRALAGRIAASLEPIASSVGDTVCCDATYLRSQLALARYYEERERMLEAYSVLAELWTSCAVRVALAAGVLERDALGEARDGKHKDLRKRAADAVRASVDGRDRDADLRVRRLLATHDALSGRLASTLRVVTERRNALDHCWIGVGDKWNKHLFGELRKEHRAAVEELAHIIPLLDALEPLAPAYLLNLTNHPLESWPDAQREAALALAPRIAEVPFPAVDPGASPEAIDALAAELIRGLEPGCTHALVMGELTLSFALVRRLRAMGVECLATTGPRLVEAGPDGSRVVRFLFEGLRRYS